jgi:mRNA interferase RelE/StbE
LSYAVFILRRARRDLAALPIDNYARMKEALQMLAEEPRPRGSRKLVGREGWRMRVGDYRIIYEIDDDQQKVTILHVGHRRDVYR